MVRLGQALMDVAGALLQKLLQDSGICGCSITPRCSRHPWCLTSEGIDSPFVCEIWGEVPFLPLSHHKSKLLKVSLTQPIRLGLKDFPVQQSSLT